MADRVKLSADAAKASGSKLWKKKKKNCTHMTLKRKCHQDEREKKHLSFVMWLIDELEGDVFHPQPDSAPFAFAFFFLNASSTGFSAWTSTVTLTVPEGVAGWRPLSVSVLVGHAWLHVFFQFVFSKTQSRCSASVSESRKVREKPCSLYC